jgi:DNA-binding CsgD family transcriptional regulator
LPNVAAALCHDSSVHRPEQTGPQLRDNTTDDESRLLDMVRASSRSVAVYDVSAPTLLAVSERAREQLGFGDTELATVDLLERASDPDGVRKLLALIRDGQLKAWRFRSWLRTPDGGRSWDFATGHAIDVGGRRLGLVSYDPPTTPVSDPAWDALLDPGPLDESSNSRSRAAPRARVPAGDDRLRDRVLELEDVLLRISREVEAAGIRTISVVGNSPELPGLDRLSPREREIVRRLLVGERVPTIARQLGLSASTVRNHLSRIYRKVGVHSQVQLIEALQDTNNRSPSG